MKVLYFTATGNSLYIAKSLGGELLSIPKLIKEEIYELTDDKIGIIFPIYSNKVPPYVEEFLEKATFNCEYLFAIATYGAYAAATQDHLVQIATRAGYEFSYINIIKMVDNWIPGFNMDNQVKNEHKKQIEKHLESVKQDIEQSKQWMKKVSSFSKLVTERSIRVSRKPQTKASLHGAVTGNGIKSFLTVEDTCTRCGTCSRVCPVDNITVDKEAGVSLSAHCVSCFACTHNCPVNAMRLKGERSRARYRNQHVKVQEIIKANN